MRERSIVTIIEKKGANYPKDKMFWCPDQEYIELIGIYDHYIDNNDVFAMLRELFFEMGMDKDNYGKESWNPLGDKLIEEGQSILIKPNMVIEQNKGNGGVECLYTNPSLVAALIPYVWKALGGKGKIVVADAPIQSCEFETLCESAGYYDMIDYFKNKGVAIELYDLRGVKSFVDSGLLSQSFVGHDNFIVDLGNQSAHAELPDEIIERERITCYDPNELRQHHNAEKHEYCVAKEVLEADVIINLPKPKSHRYAGVTICMKNFVGINVHKEFLPHHRVGDMSKGGDEYPKASKILEISSKFMDKRNEKMNSGKLTRARIDFLISKILEHGYKKINPDKGHTYGSWYGNDTIWRTVVDLNRIVMFADKSGVMKNEQQRKVLNIADMIVAGDGEGPLTPDPVYMGMLVAGENVVDTDVVIATLMGFDVEKIPLYRGLDLGKYESYRLEYGKGVVLTSNEEKYMVTSIKDLRGKSGFHCKPTVGWIGHIEL